MAYFEQQQTGLGRRYLDAVESAIAKACASPKRHRVELAPDVRRIFVNGFPFAILYREVDDTVQILAVPHYRRMPRYWLGRLS